jgi:hypothetical protein
MSAPSRVKLEKVRDARTQPIFVAFADVAGRFVALELAELARKGELLLVGERLLAKHQDGVALHGRIDRVRVERSQLGAAFDAADLRGECAWNPTNDDRHAKPPCGLSGRCSLQARGKTRA